MELKYRDLAGRIGNIKTKSGRYETPLLLPVVNPNKMTIAPSKMKKKFGVEGIITNSYIIGKNPHLREQALKGIKKFLNFDGFVMTDSGAFQLMTYGDIDVSNEEIIEFQEKIDVDVGVILDIPGLGTYKKMKANVEETLKRAEAAKDRKTMFAGPVQGGLYKSLRQRSAKALLDMGFEYFAVGSVVPLLNQYEFGKAFDVLVWTREVLPAESIVHFFGAGHPMMFAFGVALGADVFDSAAYALFAKAGRYLTENGTLNINEMNYLPCSCPVCSNHDVEDLKRDPNLLARHNLYTTMEEMKRIKEAIREGTLWELLDRRARSHPKLYSAFKRFRKYLPYLEGKDPISKTRFFYLSSETKNRVEVYRHKLKGSGLKSKNFVDVKYFGKVPSEVLDMYPFGQMEGIKLEANTENIPDIDVVNGILGYIYGYYNLITPNAKIEKSKKTGRIRAVYNGEELLLTLKASDYMPVLHGIGKEFVKRKSWSVTIPDNISEFARDGKSVFAKFVINADDRIRPGIEVCIINESGKLLNTGTAMMSGREMIMAKEGIAVKTRKLKSK